MTTINDIYHLALGFINNFLKDKFKDQGHHLTGAFEDSLDAVIDGSNSNAQTMEGFGLYYGSIVNAGVPAQHASMKQFPFMVRYFQQRGLSLQEAKGAAAATIHTWMKEGMSTEASKRFSRTGERQDFIENAFTDNNSRLDNFMSTQYDNMVDELYHQEKSETI